LSILARLRQATADYPRQFWIILGGILINSTGGSMVWPFLTIYLRQRLAIPLTTVTLLLTVNAVAGLVATSVAGPVVDRFGRKGVMVLSLVVGGAIMLALSAAGTLQLWVILMAVGGAFSPLFRVGNDAMVADLIAPERRASAYALVRMINNLGIAIGPSVGGFVAVVSYAIAFGIAAAANLIFALLILFLVAETIPSRHREALAQHSTADQPQAEAGYGPLLRDRPFLAFCGVYALAVMVSPLLMVLLPVYAKENFGVPENQYGFIMATNAAMVVLFQYAVTRVSSRYPHLPVLAVGSLFYALGAGSVAWGWNFPTFLTSMVILTIGELLLVPTATTLTANLAPPEMRGRYMGVYGLTWGVALGIGPVMGGFLNDHVAPVAIWYGGLAIGLAAMLGFVLLARRLRVREASPGA
jgi:MFS family permease